MESWQQENEMEPEDRKTVVLAFIAGVCFVALAFALATLLAGIGY